jgi:hypothetical protein
MGNNGVTARVKLPPDVVPGEAEELTVALSGTVLSTFLQPEPFVTAFHVAILSARDSSMAATEKLWWAQCIMANQYRYSYGRQANRSLGTLDLPDTIPAYVTAAQLPELGEVSAAAGARQPLPALSTWNDFTLGDLFDIRKGSRMTRRSRVSGKVPFVAAAAVNNGVVDYVQGPPQFSGRNITVPYNGIGGVGYAFLQRTPFCASDDVNILIPRSDIPAFALLFVCVVLRHERYRFSFGRKWNLDRMQDSVIKLPSANGQPDWSTMSDYMKGLPYATGAEVILSYG